MAKQAQINTGAVDLNQANESDKRVKLGFISTNKLSTVCGPKNITELKKAQEQLAAAREVITRLKAEITGAVCKKLNITDVDTVDLAMGPEKTILYRRPAEKARKVKNTVNELLAD
jgi:hypothetical protein